MKNLPALIFVLATLFCPTLLTAKAFEGTVTMDISSGREGTHTLTYSIKDGLLRTDIQVNANMTAAAIMNLAKDEMIILMPGQSMYMTMPIKRTAEKAAGHAGDDVTLENTGTTEEILGYTCTKYLAKSKEGITEIWATSELGAFMGLGNAMGGPMSRKSSRAGWEQALIGKDFFPLRVAGGGKGSRAFRLEATAVEAKSLPASHFAPPEGYKKFDMGGMMQGMGGNPFSR